MRSLIAVGVIALCLAGCARASDESGKDSSTPASPATDANASNAPPTHEHVEPEPDGTYTSSCDYLLGDFTESATGYRFVADVRLRNTGNVGTVTRVTARWFLAGGDEITDQKSVRLEPGTTRRVGFVHVVTEDQIDLHQALGYSQKTCAVKAAMVETFGEPAA